MEELKLKITDVSKHIGKSEEISSRFSDAEKKKLAKVSKDFESMLTSMMMKSMTKTTEGGLFGEESYGGDILDTMFESELSGFITNKRGFGIAEMIYKKMTGENLEHDQIGTFIDRVKNLKVPKEIKNSLDAILPSNSSMKRLEKYDDIISEASAKYGLDSNIIKSIILAESAANPKAISKANAKGLMQLIDSTAKNMGVRNSFDPEDNIMGGTKYFSQMLRKYDGNIELALAAYNAGPGNVDKYDGVPPFEETKNYIQRVLGYYNHFNG